MGVSDLTRLQLVDGYTAETGGQQTVYRDVVLRESTYGDEMAARQAAERPVQTGAGWRLLESQAAYDRAMLARQIVRLEAAGGPSLPGSALDLDKLSPLDIAKIHNQLQMLELSASVRHGLLSQEDFDAYVQGETGGTSERGRANEPAGTAAGSEVPGEADRV